MADLVARERARSPENAAREFDCIVQDDDSRAFPDSDRCFVTPHWSSYRAGAPFAFCDPGESLDDFVLGLCTMLEPIRQTEYLRLAPPPGMGISPDVFIGYATDENGRRIPLPQPKDPVLSIYHLACWEGPRVRELGMKRVVEEIATTLKKNGIDLLFSDQRGAPYLGALLSDRQIRFRSFAMTAQNKHEAVTLMRTLMRDGNLTITPDSPHSATFKKQLTQYRRITLAGGGYKYTGGTRSAVDDWAAGLVTLGVVLGYERGNPTDETYFNIEGAPTTKTLGRKFVLAPGGGYFA
jgi:hypothetical protein